MEKQEIQEMCRPLLLEMMKMQKKTDALIFHKMRLEKVPSVEQYKFAILDELGEFNHELKPKWCWWKKNPGKIDEEKVLEELVDVWHFCLSFIVWKSGRYVSDIEKFLDRIDFTDSCPYDPYNFIVTVNISMNGPYISYTMLNKLIAIGNGLGLDFAQVYEAYKVKNDENNRRAKSSY